MVGGVNIIFIRSIMSQQMAVNRIKKDFDKIHKEEENGILVNWDESNMLKATALIEGPEGTPWEGGIF